MMNDDDKLLKYKLQTLLRDNVMEIKFTKKDGTLRTMHCTLKDDMIPIPGWKPGSEGHERENKRVIPEHTLAVWDIDNDGWRSFIVHNVSDYVVLREEYA